MSDLRPLSESSDDELERALLGSVRAELPRPSALRDTALALGLASSTASALAATLAVPSTLGTVPIVNAVSAAAAPFGSSGSAVAMSSAATGAATTGLSSAVGTVGAASFGVLGKGLLAGALVSFLALSAVDRTLGTSSNRTPPARPAPSAVRHLEPPAQGPTKQPAAVAAPAAASSDTEPEPSPAPLSHGGGRRATPLAELAPIAEPPPRSAAPTNAAFEPVPPPQPTPSALADASLAAEIRLLDQARAALAAGDVDRASRLLDAHAAGRPSSVLAQEAALLRVRLLLARGQRAAATELARRIIAQHPESAHVDSLRRLAAEP